MKLYLLLLGFLAFTAATEQAKETELFLKKNNLLASLFALDLLYKEALDAEAISKLKYLEQLIYEELFLFGYDKATINIELTRLRKAKYGYGSARRPVYPTAPPHGYGTQYSQGKSVVAVNHSYSSHSHSSSRVSHHYVPKNPCRSRKTNYYVTEKHIKGFYPDEICYEVSKYFLPRPKGAGAKPAVSVANGLPPPTCQTRCVYRGDLLITAGFHDGTYLMPFNADVAVVFGGKKCANVFFKPRAGYKVFAPEGGHRYGCAGSTGDKVESITTCQCMCAKEQHGRGGRGVAGEPNDEAGEPNDEAGEPNDEATTKPPPTTTTTAEVTTPTTDVP